MSELLAQLAAQAALLDDEQMATRASRGLLRRARKVLSEGVVCAIDDRGGEVVVAIGDLQVTFERALIAAPRCTCASETVCHHALMAMITLASAMVSGDVEGSPHSRADDLPTAVVPSIGSAAPDLLAALVGTDATSLIAHAGLPGYRWAHGLLQEIDPADVTVDTTAGVTIRTVRPSLAFHSVGGGLAGVMGESVTARQQVLAVLLVQRHSGHAVAPPPGSTKTAAPRLALGEDHLVPLGVDDARFALRMQVLTAVDDLAGDCVELGLAHLSDVMATRWTAIGTAAQAAEYPRLALTARRLADHIRTIAARAVGADEERLFEQLTFAFALSSALRVALRRGADAPQLSGRARSRYEDTAEIELVGVGGYPWRTASGHTGLTMLFWCAADRSFVSFSESRPVGRGVLDPVARYVAGGPWEGCPSPSATVGALVRLQRPRLSAQGRLSSSEQTRARISAVPDVCARLPVVDDWRHLGPSDGRADSLLAEQRPMAAWVCIRPARHHPAVFDPIRQICTWRLEDARGSLLTAELPYSTFNAPAIDQLEALTSRRLASGAVVVGRVEGRGDARVLFPLSLVLPEKGGDRVVELFFAAADTPSRRRGRRTISSDAMVTTVGADVHVAALARMTSWLLAQAERGVPAVSASWVSELDALRSSCATVGLVAFPASGGERLAAWCLQMHHVARQYQHLASSAAAAEDWEADGGLVSDTDPPTV